MKPTDDLIAVLIEHLTAAGFCCLLKPESMVITIEERVAISVHCGCIHVERLMISVHCGCIHVERLMIYGSRDIEYDHKDIPLGDPDSLDQLVTLLRAPTSF